MVWFSHYIKKEGEEKNNNLTYNFEKNKLRIFFKLFHI